jgi:sortase B
MKKKTGTIIQIGCLVVLLGCGAYLGKYYYESHKAQSEISQLQQVVEENTSEETVEEPRAENGMLMSYYDLYNQNNDMVGWLKIDDTKINYPVMQSDNEEYLHKNFEKEYQYCGLPFMDYQCDANKPSDNVIIYAHNMKDGSMFAALSKYDDESFYNAHQIIYFDTLYERAQYEVLFAFRSKIGSNDEFKYYEFTDAGSVEEFDKFIEKAKSMAIYDTKKSAEYGDKLLTLSTCSYNTSNERFVVIAKKIK